MFWHPIENKFPDFSSLKEAFLQNKTQGVTQGTWAHHHNLPLGTPIV